MPTIFVTQDNRKSGGKVLQTAYQSFSGTGQTDWVQFSNTDITVQVDGGGSAVNVIVERTAIEPVGGVALYAAPASDTPITGSPAGGIAPNVYIEPGAGWWRARVTSLTGTPVLVYLTGAISK